MSHAHSSKFSASDAFAAAAHVLGNLLSKRGVHSDKLDELRRWRGGNAKGKASALTSAALFSTGTAALLPVASGVAKRMKPGAARKIATAGLAVASVANVAGAPLIAVAKGTKKRSSAERLLQRAVDADAVFNAALGVSLIALAIGDDESPGWKRALAFAAGAACVPVALRSRSSRSARLVGGAGPLWLAAVAALSLPSARAA